MTCGGVSPSPCLGSSAKQVACARWSWRAARTHTLPVINVAYGGPDAPRDWAKGERARAATPSSPTPQAQLSFADDLEEDGGEAGGPGGGSGVAADGGSRGREGSGGLRAATASRFKEEKRAAAREQQHHHLFASHRQDTGGGGGEGGGGPATGAGVLSSPRRSHGLAVVDDEAAAAVGPGHSGASGPTVGRVHFGAASARGMRPYMEDRHCVVASMQLLSSVQGDGAQAGAPLPPDGVPRSYAAIFDGAWGAREARCGAALSWLGSCSVSSVRRIAPPPACHFCTTPGLDPKYSDGSTPQGTTALAAPSSRPRACTCCWRRTPRCARTRATWGRPRWREPRRSRSRRRCAQPLGRWTRRRWRCPGATASATARRPWLCCGSGR